MSFFSLENLIEASYFLAAVLFIMGLKKMSSPVTARGGIVWAGAGMVVATVVTFLYPGMGNYMLMMIAGCGKATFYFHEESCLLLHRFSCTYEQCVMTLGRAR